MSKGKRTPKDRNYIVSAVVSAVVSGIVVIPLTTFFFPDLIQMNIWDVWSFRGTGVGDWASVIWPFLLWSLVLNVAVQLWLGPASAFEALGKLFAPTRGQIFVVGLVKSAWHGVTEELAFRWLIFFGSFAGLALGNFLLFGFLGFGIAEWVHEWILGPLANWTTLGYLEPWIFDKGWLFGAAMIATNAFFRDGHKYQGIVGILNSWFIGMALFYVTFTCGLLAAIVMHFLFNIIAYSTVAIFRGSDG